ncbi:MAG: hypothetical protein AB7O96_02865 [Pseudobdellovibrionaceae bacterium]
MRTVFFTALISFGLLLSACGKDKSLKYIPAPDKGDNLFKGKSPAAVIREKYEKADFICEFSATDDRASDEVVVLTWNFLNPDFSFRPLIFQKRLAHRKVEIRVDLQSVQIIPKRLLKIGGVQYRLLYTPEIDIRVGFVESILPPSAEPYALYEKDQELEIVRKKGERSEAVLCGFDAVLKPKYQDHFREAF